MEKTAAGSSRKEERQGIVADLKKANFTYEDIGMMLGISAPAPGSSPTEPTNNKAEARRL